MASAGAGVDGAEHAGRARGVRGPVPTRPGCASDGRRARGARWGARCRVRSLSRDLRWAAGVEEGMKKRSMLAIASLATGFVVAAITPSHGQDHDSHHDLGVGDTLSALDHAIADDGSLAVDDNALGQAG